MIDYSDNFGDESDGEEFPILPIIVALEASLGLVALVLGWALGHHPLTDFQWTTRAAIEGLAATLPLIGFLWLSDRWRFEPILRIRDFLREHLLPYLHDANLLDLAMLSIAAGVGEEILFRGFLQSWLTMQFGIVAAIGLTALVFGLLHPVSITYVVIATLIGAYLGGVWLVSGNLLAPIVTHAVYDFVAVLILLGDSGEEESEPD